MYLGGGYDEDSFVAELYDHIPPYRERQDIGFFVEAAKEAGSPVLELGCGTGRVLLPIARAGIKIVGLDLSSHMLAVCNQKLSHESQEVQGRVRLVQADMRSFQIDHKFHLAIIPFRAFQHLLTVDEQLACLRCAHHHLADGGILVLDIFNPSLNFLVNSPIEVEFGEEPEFLTPDGRRVIRRHKTISRDHFAQVNEVELIYYVKHPDGREGRLVHAFPFRYFFRFEAEHLLARAEFRVEHLYADYDKSLHSAKPPIRANTQRGELLFVARKNS